MKSFVYRDYKKGYLSLLFKNEEYLSTPAGPRIGICEVFSPGIHHFICGNLIGSFFEVSGRSIYYPDHLPKPQKNKLITECFAH